MISKIGLVGKAGAGKSSVANYLIEKHNFYRVSFAGKLKSIASDLFFMPVKDRILLQKLGSKMREIREDVWVDYLLADLKYIKGFNVVIDDVRYLNEVKILKEEGFIIIKLVRSREKRALTYPDIADFEGHPSETEQDLIEADFNVDSDRSLEDVYRDIEKIVDEVTE